MGGDGRLSSSTSTVQAALGELRRASADSAPPVLIGFDASRHLSRGDLGDVESLTLDVAISEETTMGVAIGVSLAGRDVVVDFMFEGFLSRCMEPLLVGWPTAIGLTHRRPGRIVLRTLGTPIRFGGPSHSAGLLPLLEGIGHMEVIHVTGTADVTWALSSVPDFKIIALADPVRPDLIRGELIHQTTAGPPLRVWKRGCSTVMVCSHANSPDIVELIESELLDVDLLTSPLTNLRRDYVSGALAPYGNVELRGVQIVDD